MFKLHTYIIYQNVQEFILILTVIISATTYNYEHLFEDYFLIFVSHSNLNILKLPLKLICLSVADWSL